MFVLAVARRGRFRTCAGPAHGGDELRADRILEEVLSRGPDAPHLARVFRIEASTAIRYAEQAQRIITDC
jgi:hypothetical protein